MTTPTGVAMIVVSEADFRLNPNRPLEPVLILFEC